MLKSLMSVGVLIAVSGCGGASTGESFASVTNTHRATYAEGVRISDLAREYETTPADAPALQGSAVYKGVMAIELPGVSTTIDRVDGDLTLEIDFAEDVISGFASDFHSALNGPVVGEVAIVDGIIVDDTDQKRMLAEFEGDVELARVVREVSGLLVGEFRGDEGQTLTGGAFGTFPVTAPPSSPLSVLNVDRLSFEGGFVTERDATR